MTEVELVWFTTEDAVREQAAALVERERARIVAVVPGGEVHHVGATSIPGARTKGDVDLCVRVSAAAFQAADAALAALYERNTGSTHSPTFSAFKDDAMTPQLGVQLCVTDGPEDFFLRARARLLASPELAREYDALKAAWHGKSHADYRAAKSAFWERVLG